MVWLGCRSMTYQRMVNMMGPEDNAEKIRDRAYFLWEQAGRPIGREHEFWAQASREIEGDPKNGPDNSRDNRSIAR